MANYRTPDVYVEEIPTLPPSIAEVSTAIPAFLGYTQYAVKGTNVPVRISSMLEYRTFFGGPDTISFTVAVAKDADPSKADGKYVVKSVDDPVLDNKLYYSLDHFFKNGGSNCYIISLGAYGAAKDKKDFEAGLAALSKEDEPTLIILSEAATLAAPDYYDLCQQALVQCAELKDRFCIFDVLPTDENAVEFKGATGIGMNNLKYGAAYYPYLNTSLNYLYVDADVAVSGIAGPAAPANPAPVAPPANVNYSVDLGGIKVIYTGTANESPAVDVVAGASTKDVTITIADAKLTITNVKGRVGNDVVDAFTGLGDKGKFAVEKIGDGSAAVTVGTGTALMAEPAAPAAPPVGAPGGKSSSLGDLKNSYTALYNSIKLELNKYKVVLPPSPAVAGVYATIDRERGVWKAPANVSLNAVINPVVKITANDQERLNIDETGGKSINAIRSFMGKGTLIWGARTLDGNDNEWRYISVRRLFNMIEESAKKASYFAVFEPNHPTTWLKVKGMIDSYLYGLWQQGALAGSTAQTAYYVNVGLGTTMTQQDILEGRMIVEIGIAAVRPAEFIVLRFSHKLQEA